MLAASSKNLPTMVFPDSFQIPMFPKSEMVKNMFIGVFLGQEHEFLGFEAPRTRGTCVIGSGVIEEVYQ